MIITAEFTPNPGPNARFVTGINFAKKKEIYMDRYWWDVSFSFWLYTWETRKKWFFDYENSNDGSWKTRKLMICGFEFLWQRLDKEKGGLW